MGIFRCIILLYQHRTCSDHISGIQIGFQALKPKPDKSTNQKLYGTVTDIAKNGSSDHTTQIMGTKPCHPCISFHNIIHIQMYSTWGLTKEAFQRRFIQPRMKSNVIIDHTTNEISKNIAVQHFNQFNDYYTELHFKASHRLNHQVIHHRAIKAPTLATFQIEHQKLLI